jgi:hypothetical protein
MKKALWLLSLLVLTVSLTACGGSSGSSDTTTSSTPSSLSGAVASAPVKDAKVMVSFDSLTAEAQKATALKDQKKPVQVGLTDKTGAIKFDAAAVAKLDRTKDIVLYSAGGVQFTSAYETEKAVADAGAGADANLYKGSMKAVLAPKATTAYLTPANTLVAELVKGGDTLAEATRKVNNLVKVQLGLVAMENPLGNPLTDLAKSEFTTQALLAVLNVTEDALIAGTAVDFADKLSKVSSTAILDKAAFDAAVKSVEKYLGKAHAAKLAQDEVISTAVLTTSMSLNSTITGDLKEALGTNVFAVAYKDTAASSTFAFTIDSTSNTAGKAGKFLMTAAPAVGTVSAKGETVVADPKKEFEGSVTFNYTLTKDEYTAAIGSTRTFTFVAVNGEYVTPVTLTVKYTNENEVVISGFEFTTTEATKLVELADAAKKVMSIEDEDEVKFAQIALDTSNTAYELKIDTINKFKADAKITVAVKAPEGFHFIKGSGDLAEGNSISADKLTFTTTVVPGNVDTKTFKVGDANLILKSSATQDAGKRVLSATVSGTDFAAVSTDNKQPESAKYFIAAGSKTFPHEITVEATTAGDDEMEIAHDAAKKFAGSLEIKFETWESIVADAEKAVAAGSWKLVAAGTPAPAILAADTTSVSAVDNLSFATAPKAHAADPTADLATTIADAGKAGFAGTNATDDTDYALDLVSTPSVSGWESVTSTVKGVFTLKAD